MYRKINIAQTPASTSNAENGDRYTWSVIFVGTTPALFRRGQIEKPSSSAARSVAFTLDFQDILNFQRLSNVRRWEQVENNQFFVTIAKSTSSSKLLKDDQLKKSWLHYIH